MLGVKTTNAFMCLASKLTVQRSEYKTLGSGEDCGKMESSYSTWSHHNSNDKTTPFWPTEGNVQVLPTGLPAREHRLLKNIKMWEMFMVYF